MSRQIPRSPLKLGHSRKLLQSQKVQNRPVDLSSPRWQSSRRVPGRFLSAHGQTPTSGSPLAPRRGAPYGVSPTHYGREGRALARSPLAPHGTARAARAVPLTPLIPERLFLLHRVSVFLASAGPGKGLPHRIEEPFRDHAADPIPLPRFCSPEERRPAVGRDGIDECINGRPCVE